MNDRAGIRPLYEDYIGTVERLERDRKPGEGLLGLKGGPADHPCHEQFAADLAAAVRGFAARGPAPAEAAETLSYMFRVPLEHPEPRSAYWMLIAVQGLALELTEYLTPADAGLLAEEYGRAFPRRERLPVQKKVLSALKSHSRGA